MKKSKFWIDSAECESCQWTKAYVMFVQGPYSSRSSAICLECITKLFRKAGA
jgi:hypothetical protein